MRVGTGAPREDAGYNAFELFLVRKHVEHLDFSAQKCGGIRCLRKRFVPPIIAAGK